MSRMMLLLAATLLSGCVSTDKNEPPSDIELPYTLDRSAFLWQFKECVFDIRDPKNIKTYIGKHGCERTDYIKDDIYVEKLLILLSTSSNHDYIKFLDGVVTSYERPKPNLPMKYKIFPNDNSPYGNKKCLFKISDEKITNLQSSTTDYSCEGISSFYDYLDPYRIKKLIDEDDGLYSTLWSIAYSKKYNAVTVSDGLINSFNIPSIDEQNYKQELTLDLIKDKENLSKLHNGKYKIKIDDKGNSFTPGEIISRKISLDKHLIKVGDSYTATNAFNVSRIVTVKHYQQTILKIIEPNPIEDRSVKPVEAGSVCIGYDYITMSGKGKSLHDAKKLGKITLYGEIAKDKSSYIEKNFPTLDFPVEEHIHTETINFKLHGIKQGNRFLDIYKCGL
ncbi:hypothetical protein [Ferrimonas sp. YFM]|uniref:hypothetical protein n=1 Tax=Ferrimonas sp. YFM TaxID=3028878 RepID=UPI00257380D4|nr:hypothetical protein [Ferrimonas sp. YFM]BDY05425.1 hypothetical protein F0521_24660 [Ferrimonas sp. YFM]